MQGSAGKVLPFLGMENEDNRDCFDNRELEKQKEKSR